ncbi:MAG: hypothetical protein ACMUHU_01920 [Thermoplasmatota archaeon]
MNGSQRILCSFSIIMLMVLPGVPSLLPTERTGSEDAFGNAPSFEERILSDPPASGYYNMKVLHVGGFGPGNYTSLQDALDDAEDRDQVWVYSGSYSEALTVKDEIWIKAAAGTRLMNPGGMNNGITIDTNNVTVTGFNITDFNIGIYSTFSGHNITQNILWMNEYGIVLRDTVQNMDHDYFNYGYVIRDNDITQLSSQNAIEMDINLDFDMGGPYSFKVEDVVIERNEILVLNSGTVVVALYLSVTDIGRGGGRIGDHRLIGNDIEGGWGGIDLMGDLRQLRDLDLIVGDIEMTSNIVSEYVSYGIGVHYFNIQMMTGNTSLSFGDIIISENQVGSSTPSARGIVFDYLYYIISIREASSIKYGELLVLENTIDTPGNGISAYSPDPGYEVFDNSSVSIGKNSISDNIILNGQVGILYSFSNLHNHLGSTSFIFQGLAIEGNSIRSMTQGIELHLSRVGFALSADAEMVIGEISVRGNSMVSGSTGVHIGMDVIGNGMTGTSTFSWDGMNISKNIIRAATGIDVHAFRDAAGQLYNTTVSKIGNISIYDNRISATGTGVHFDELNNFGSILFGEARAEMGEISVSKNMFDCGGMGIHFTGLNQFGWRLSDNSSFVFKGLDVSHNDIVSDSNAVHLDHMMAFGNYLYNYSSVVVGGIHFNGNTVRSNQTGIRIGRMDYFGNYLFESSSMVVGTVEVSGNDVGSNETGILFTSFSMNGYMLYSLSSVKIGDVLIIDNKVVSRLASGIHFGQYMNNGYLLHDNSTVALGKLCISRNVITSEYSALFFMGYGYLAYVLFNYSRVDVGALEITENEIGSGGEGIVIFGLYYICYVLNHHSKAGYEGINISGNLITCFVTGLYLHNFGGLGYQMRDMSIAAVGPFRLDENVVKTKGNGIQIDMMYGFGYDITGNADVKLDGFSLSDNQVDAGRRGIWVGGFSNNNQQVEGEATTSIGNFTIASNVVNSGDGGIHFDSMEYINSDLKVNASAHLGKFRVLRNDITTSKGTGLAFWRMSQWGSGNMHRTLGRMDGFEFSDNVISSPDTALLLEFRQLGGYMEDDSRLELGPINIKDNDLASDRLGMLVDFNGVSDYSIDASSIDIEGVEVSGNLIDAEDGIELPIEIAIPSAKVKATFGDVYVSGNVFEPLVNYSLYIPVNINIGDDVRVEIGDMHILWNEIKGSEDWGISLIHEILASSTIYPSIGDIEVMGNTIENCADGLYLNHTKNVTVHANSFVKNVNDTVIDDTTIRWISRQPMWYRHGMRNFSSYLGNYWDRYTGSDANDDGIGDTPYNTGFGMDTHPLMDRVEEYLPPWNDETPPEVVITSPANGTAFNVTSVRITWVGVDDLLGIEHYDVRMDDSAWENVGMQTFHTHSGMAEGAHELFVRAVDRAGNEKIVSVHVIIDLTDPFLEVLEPQEGGFVNSSRVAVSWEGADPLSGIAGYMVKLDNGSWIDVKMAEGSIFRNVSQGYHYIEVQVRDRAGNTNRTRVDFGVDVTPPELSISYPFEALELASTSLNAEWDGSDGFSGISEFILRLDNGSWFSKGKDMEHMFLNLSEGDHTLRVRLSDIAGNRKESVVGFKVVSVEHVLSITEPLEDSYIPNSTVLVAWSAYGTTYAPSMYQIRLDSGEWEDLPVIHSFTFTGLSEGDHTVYLKLTDKGGNVETASAAFIVDTVAPAIVSFSHSGDKAPPGDPIVVKFSEVMDPAGFIIEVNDMRLQGNLTLDGKELTIRPDMGLGIDVTVDIRGRDLAGNRLSEQFSFKTASKGTIAGNLVYTDGKPVVKARIKLDTGEEVVTDMNGGFSLEATPGTRTVRIYDEKGYKLTVFEVEVVAGKTVTPTEHLTVERHKEPSGSLWWIWLIVIIAIVALLLGAVAFFIVRRPGEEEEEELDWDDDEEDYDDEEYDEDLEYSDDWDE